MRKLFTTIPIMLMVVSVFLPRQASAQAPEKISYQAVIRDANDNLITDTEIGMQISILQGTTDGAAVYVETQTPTTNANGLVSIEIGTGTTTDDFSTIDWANGPYFIKTETDPTGGTTYTIIGVSQLLSVPYALHAKTAENTVESDPVFGESVASAITITDTTNWNNKQDQLTAGTGISISDFVINATNGTSSIAMYTTSEIIALSPSAGDAVYNTTENLYQIYDGSKWVSLPANCWPQPTTANAGSNQNFTDGTVSTTLAANTPEAEHGTGQWSLVSGTGGSFADASNPNTSFTGEECTNYWLRWTITTSCGSSEDEMQIIFNQTPTVADAGDDQTFTDGTTTVTLAANSPDAEHGTGEWTIVSGTGGSFNDATSPTTTFTGQECTSYELKWTIATPCNSSSDNVNITFNQTPTVADAGADQTFTDGTTTVTLAANSPDAGHGTGEWTIVSGTGGSFTDATSPTTTFTGTPGNRYTLRWTISACSNSTDDIVIRYVAPDDVVNPTTGVIWMDKNLGASQVATASDDPDSYGDLYQWGRAADGHESRTSENYDGDANGKPSTYDESGAWNGKFILAINSPEDWLDPQNDNLWQGVSGTNNPCPSGYRLPTEAEWEAERASWSNNDAAGAFASPLKLPVAGRRSRIDGSLAGVGSVGRYWSSTVDGTQSLLLQFNISDAYMNDFYRVYGLSVRCLKD